MSKSKKFLLTGWIAAISLAGTGEVVYYTGGRPMLFGAMALWGLAGAVALIALCAVLPPVVSRVLLSLLGAAVLALVLLFVGLELHIARRSQSHITGQPEVMVVLGANLWDHQPSPILQNRLNVAAEYWKDHPEMDIIVTGGMGDDEPCSEAEAMAEMLERMGIPGEKIIQEKEAANTMQNLTFSKRILQEAGRSTENLLVVSSSSHLARAELLAGRNGLTISTLSAPVPGDRLYRCYFALREGAALVKSFLFDHISSVN